MSTNKTVKLEQVVSRCCGLDVHKKERVATVDGDGIKKETRSFSSTTRSLTDMILVVNARHTKYIPGRKTDKKDSAWICKLLLAGLLKGSFVPDQSQRDLRDLARYRRKLVQNLAAEHNQLIRIFEDANLKLSSVFSDVTGETTLSMASVKMLCHNLFLMQRFISVLGIQPNQEINRRLWKEGIKLQRLPHKC